MTFKVPEKAVYTLGESENRLTGWVNRTPFKEDVASKNDEPFFLLFTEPWIALQFRRKKLPGYTLYYADNDKAWEFYRDYATQVMQADRAIINMCWQSHEQMFFQIIPFASVTFDFLTKQPSTFTAPCTLCYIKTEMDNEQDNVSVTTVSFEI